VHDSNSSMSVLTCFEVIESKSATLDPFVMEYLTSDGLNEYLTSDGLNEYLTSDGLNEYLTVME